MKENHSDVHPEHSIMLAYLDAELPKGKMRSTEQHLQTCWKCRASFAELELQAQAVSKLLSLQDESDIRRAEAAKVKFLEQSRSSSPDATIYDPLHQPSRSTMDSGRDVGMA